MKRFVITLIAVIMVMSMVLPMSALAAGEFIQSEGAYQNTVNEIDEQTSGIKGAIGYIDDGQGKRTYITLADLQVTDANEKETKENEDALERTEKVVNDIDKADGVSNLLDDNVKKDVEDDGIKPENLVVASVFDVVLPEGLKAGESVTFTLDSPALQAMSNSDIYTGKFVVFCRNPQTGALTRITTVTKQGSQLAFTVNQAGVYVVAFEVNDQYSPRTGDSNIRAIWIALLGVGAVGFCGALFIGKKKETN